MCKKSAHSLRPVSRARPESCEQQAKSCNFFGLCYNKTNGRAGDWNDIYPDRRGPETSGREENTMPLIAGIAPAVSGVLGFILQIRRIGENPK
jgi:hypothetical protein